MIKLISVVKDFKTNEVLKSELGTNSTNCKSKNELLRRLNEQEEGSMVFIIGHHENGKFITHDEAGNFAYEFSASEISQISKDKNINIFPLGCKTAFSEFNQGSNIDLNSVDLSKALIKAIKTSNTFGDLLKNISKTEPNLKFLVEDNSFGAVNVEVFQDKNWRTRVIPNSQQDSTQQERDYANFVKTIKISKYGGGYIFTISENRNESESNTIIESPTSNTEYKSGENKFGWELIKYGFIGILALGFISKIISFADDAQKVGCTSIVSMLILLCMICMAIGTCMNCAN